MGKWRWMEGVVEMGRCREIGGMRDRKWAVERDGGMKWVVYSYIL